MTLVMVVITDVLEIWSAFNNLINMLVISYNLCKNDKDFLIYTNDFEDQHSYMRSRVKFKSIHSVVKTPKAPKPTAPPPFPHYVDFSPFPLLPGIWSSIFPHQTKSHTNPQPQTNITRSHRQRTEFDVWLKIRPLKPN